MGKCGITILITYLENGIGANMLKRAAESCPCLQLSTEDKIRRKPTNK